MPEKSAAIESRVPTLDPTKRISTDLLPQLPTPLTPENPMPGVYQPPIFSPTPLK